MLLVQAGKAVDAFIETLLPHIEKGDIIIDGGNSHYPDTNRRTRALDEKGILFIGTGVSGGEEGARYGPSLMPGGNEVGYGIGTATISIDNHLGCLAARERDIPGNRSQIRQGTLL